MKTRCSACAETLQYYYKFSPNGMSTDRNLLILLRSTSVDVASTPAYSHAHNPVLMKNAMPVYADVGSSPLAKSESDPHAAKRE
jgi:hypothetical protein